MDMQIVDHIPNSVWILWRDQALLLFAVLPSVGIYPQLRREKQPLGHPSSHSALPDGGKAHLFAKRPYNSECPGYHACNASSMYFAENRPR